MKQREKCSGRGCESPQVHQKFIMSKDWDEGLGSYRFPCPREPCSPILRDTPGG